MTLIITELSGLGIAMAADTAGTLSGKNVRGVIEDRAFLGLTKLLPVRKLESGISYWGWATIPTDAESGIWMDWWLKVFLAENQPSYSSISDLAVLLEKELRKVVPPLSEDELEITPNGTGGVHLAGFVENDGKKRPCFWHIHNGKSQTLPDKDLDPCLVNANFDCPPERCLQEIEKGHGIIVRNGDIEAYARFFERYLVDYVRELNSELEIAIPLPRIQFRAEFLRAQIKFMSELYAIAGIHEDGTIKQMARSIGEVVTTLTITEKGIQEYITR